MMKQSRSEKLQRLVKVQRHLENMAENELAATTRARTEVQEGLDAVVDAIGSLEPIHQIFAGLYSSQISRLTAKDGSFYFNLAAANGEIIGSSEMYTTAAARDKGIESVKANGPTGVVKDQT